MTAFDAGERFEIGNQLGAGSFGVVYEAFDRRRDHAVALKVLERAVPDSVARFKREFRSLAELRHPNLASLYELLVVREQWMLSMERIAGKELLEHLAIRPRSFDDTLRISYAHIRDCFRQLAAGITALHAHGIVHRDIKPSNVMITPQGRVVLLDFGLAARVELDDTIDAFRIVGTPGYMSPEQLRGATPSAASDWYGFGVLLFQALTGSLPFSGSTPLEILDKQLHVPAPSAAEILPSVPADLDALCRDLLAVDPDQRPGDAVVLRRLGGAIAHRIQREEKRTPDFLGRRRELRTLQRTFDVLRPGKPRVVVVKSAPGCGKSALVGTFLDRLRQTSSPMILGARCRPWESVPLNAIDSLVDSLARWLRHHGSPAVDDALGRSVAATRLFPLLVPRTPLPFGDKTVQLPPNGRRMVARAASELSNIIAAAAAGRSVIILLDDAQWASADSAHMLAAIVSGLYDHRLMIVICARTDEPSAEEFVDAVDAKKREIVLRDPPRGNPMLMDMMSAERARTLGAAIESRLRRLSPAARALFDRLVDAGGPLPEHSDLDEPLRSLSRERLARVRRDRDALSIDVYHPLMRTAMRRRRHDRSHAVLLRHPIE